MEEAKIYDSYIELLEFLEKDSKKLVPSRFIINKFMDEKTNEEFLEITKFPINTSFSYEYSSYDKIFSLKYKIEKEIKDIFLKILNLEGDKKETRLLSCINNNYNFVCYMPILRLILTKYKLENSGEKIFNVFKIKKKNGKLRTIVAPHEMIKKELRSLDNILQRTYNCRNSDFQIAYKKHKNIKDGAKIHKNNQYVYNIDLKDFFPSCKRNLIDRYIDFLFFSSFNRELLKDEFYKIILMDDGLFIGNPISGVLANTIISVPMTYLNNICKNYNISLSVYADDISFSSSKFISKKFVLSLMSAVFKQYSLTDYFKINDSKCVGYSKNNRKITGVSINDSNNITVKRKYYRELRTMIHHLSIGDKDINLQVLRGKIAYGMMIDESGKILKYLEKFKPTIEKYNLYNFERKEK